MINNKKWIKLTIVLVLGVCFANVTFLFTIDTYSIRHPYTKTYYTIPNQRFLIVDYLLDKVHYKKYDSYIFGSSRVGNINPLHIKNFATYNMTYGEGIPHEHLLIIKLFLREGVPIKHLLIAFDEFSYQVPFSKHDNQFGSKSHYLATQTSIHNFYKFYFVHKPTNFDTLHFKRKYIQHKPIYKGLSDNIYNEIYDQENLYKNIKVTNNHNKKYINDPRFDIPTSYEGDALEDTINDIKEIVKLAKQNHIELHLLINPIHHTTYKSTNKELLKKFRKELAKITSYYDFSYPSYISKDNGYWYDTSHYNVNIGNMILSKIYDKNSSVKNFGIFVKKKDD